MRWETVWQGNAAASVERLIVNLALATRDQYADTSIKGNTSPNMTGKGTRQVH